MVLTTPRVLLLFCGAVLIATSSACSRSGGAVVPHAATANSQTGSPHASNSAWKVPDRFAAAIGKKLSDNDIDSYIDPSVVGADRDLARKLMRMMPPNRRGDFVLHDGDRIISNNRALIPETQLIERPSVSKIASNSRPASVSSATRRPRGDTGCWPASPHGSGPYIRQVGACGFTGAWMIVKLQCNTTRMFTSVEAGYMYAELRDANAALYEAGMFTSTGLPGGQDIDPYLSGSTNRTLNNRNFRYSCDTYLALMAGLAPNPNGGAPYLYVSIGEIANYNPQNAFLTSETVTVQRPAWLFESAYGDFNHPGQDAAGVATPCTVCSITKVTSIGQNNPVGDSTTGSYFGVTNNGSGDNAVHYYEVTFGNWVNGCNQYLCTLRYTTDSSRWYAGPEFYPNSYAASSFFNPNGAVYESEDGITADFGPMDSGKVRHPGSAFVVPAPPQCAPDAYGYCVANTTGSGPQQQYCQDRFGDVPGEYLGGWTYLIQDPNRVLRSYDHSWIDDGTGLCNSYESWSPAEPSVQLGDPNLP